MKKMISLFALMAAALSASAWAASGNVSYQCQGGKKVSVHYQFDDGTGLPVKATIRLKNPQTVYYDASSESDMESRFGNEKGYTLSAPALTINEYKKTKGIMIMNGRHEILFKSCNPSSAGNAKKQESSPKQKSNSTRVSYMCQNKRPLRVDYSFDAYGQPVQARVQVHGKNINLKYDIDASDRVSTVFEAQGYRLTGGAHLDRKNIHREKGLKLVAPSGEILNKDCRPQ